MFAMSWLPDAQAEYASMKRFTSIDVSHSEFLQNFPVGWGLFLDRFLAVDSSRLRLSNVQLNLSESNVSFRQKIGKRISVIAENCPAPTRVPPSFKV